jgi:hypothetical protein
MYVAQTQTPQYCIGFDYNESVLKAFVADQRSQLLEWNRDKSVQRGVEMNRISGERRRGAVAENAVNKHRLKT